MLVSDPSVVRSGFQATVCAVALISCSLQESLSSVTPAAQRLPHIDDLMRLILAELKAIAPFEQSCVAVALTCKQLYDLAMDAHWYAIRGVSTLAQLISGGSCQCHRPAEGCSPTAIEVKSFLCINQRGVAEYLTGHETMPAAFSSVTLSMDQSIRPIQTCQNPQHPWQ